MEEFKPTEEQEAIVEAARAGDESLMVEADAGAAKSSTLRLLGPVVRTSVLGMAFNKSTAREMQQSMPGHWSWKTANGLGHGAWIRANPGVNKWDLDDRKLGKLVSQTLRDQKIQLPADGWDQVRQLVTAAMQAGLTPDNISRPLVQDNPETWKELCEGCWIGETDQALYSQLAKDILIQSISLARKGVLSFDDQIYCSVCLGGRFTQYPRVALDEAQDLNSLNHKMVQYSLKNDGLIFAVGDKKQSIYAFRGAHTESMGQIRALRDKWRDLSLHVTFRCPKVIVERQQGHAPGFRAFEANPVGKFVELAKRDPYQIDAPTWTWADVQQELRTGWNIAILCRNNAPLMKMAFKLIRRRIGVMMLGRALGKNLVAFSRKIVEEDETPALETAALITAYQDREVALALANDKSQEAENIQDRVECLRAVLEDAEARNAGDLRRLITSLFSKEEGLVVLGTGHKAKGLEWDVVLHLDPWRIPSKQAKEAEALGDPGPMQQDQNLKYVIETRTKHTLIEAGLKEFQ